MSGLVTRRGLVRAGAAALGAVSLPAAAVALEGILPAPASPEAALVALIDQHGIATAEWNELGEQWDDLFDRWLYERPPMPTAMIARFDERLGAYPVKGRLPDGSMGFTYGDQEVEQIRAATPRSKFLGSDEPCPRATARRAEVLATYDAWKAESDAVSERVGVQEAEAKANAAYVIVERLETEILACRPSTLAAFVLKARWIQKEQSTAAWSEQLVADLCADGGADA